MSFPFTPYCSSGVQPGPFQPEGGRATQSQHDPRNTSTHPLPGSSAQHALPPTFCRMDEYAVRVAPGYKPMSKEELEEYFRYIGATDETLQEYLDNFDRQAEALLGPHGPGLRAIGLKPRPGDTNVYTVPIGGTDLVVRMWEGGMDAYSQFCLDFFDTRQQTPVNLPPGYAIHPASANMPGVFSMAGALSSWEKAFGYTADKIPAGEEKWSVPAGTYLSVVRDGRELVTFAVPQTQMHRNLMSRVVQPTLGYGR